MKNYLFASVAVIACVSTVQASPQIDGMKDMIKLLHQSVDIMKSCQDEASTKKAVEELTKLRAIVEETGKKLNNAGQASQEDMEAMMPLLNELMTLSKQGETELQRIKKANLFSPELQAVLEQKNVEPADAEVPKKELNPSEPKTTSAIICTGKYTDKQEEANPSEPKTSSTKDTFLPKKILKEKQTNGSDQKR